MRQETFTLSQNAAVDLYRHEAQDFANLSAMAALPLCRRSPRSRLISARRLVADFDPRPPGAGHRRDGFRSLDRRSNRVRRRVCPPRANVNTLSLRTQSGYVRRSLRRIMEV